MTLSEARRKAIPCRKARRPGEKVSVFVTDNDASAQAAKREGYLLGDPCFVLFCLVCKTAIELTRVADVSGWVPYGERKAVCPKCGGSHGR